MGARILLVEGSADSSFYAVWCREHRHPGVEVKPPRSYGAKVDSKTNALHVLPTIMRQLRDGSVERLGVVIDADYGATHGLGFIGTFAKVRETLEFERFQSPPKKSGSGFLFHHPDGLSPVGLWIMPDNRSEGMLEDFIKSSIGDPSQAALFGQAKNAVKNIAPRLFRDIHASKAEIATWLAWQEMPGEGVEATVSKKLIDISAASCTNFDTWLKSVFG